MPEHGLPKSMSLGNPHVVEYDQIGALGIHLILLDIPRFARCDVVAHALSFSIGCAWRPFGQVNRVAMEQTN